MINTFSMRRFIAVVLLLPVAMSLVVSCHKYNYNSPYNPAGGLAITSFAPASAVMTTTVVIKGTGFSSTPAQNQVSFNGVAATVVSATAESLTVTVPKGAHDGKITVQAGGSTASSSNDFTYIYTVTTLAGDAHAGFKEGTGTDSEFDLPFGVATDVSGNVYVADNDNNRIRIISPLGVTSTLAGDGLAYYKDTIAAAAQFRTPLGVALDGAGNVYVADANNKRIRKISPGGIVSTLAGNGTTSFKDATGTAAGFYTPTGVATDKAGNVYVADADNHRVRKITPAGVVTTLAGNGTPAYKEGTGTTAEFYYPTGVAVDVEGNVYVADNYNNRIRKITSGGAVSTLAGNGTPDFKEGTGGAAAFDNPTGVAVDAFGNVFVADTYNGRIRKITPAGVVTTAAGGGTGTYKDGPGNIAAFNEPTGVTVDASGAIYVADNFNHRIRKLE